MRRRMVIGAVVGGCLILGTGLLVWAATEGLLGPHGKAKHLLAVADRELQHGQMQQAQVSLEQLVGNFPDSPWTDQGLVKLGAVYEQQQQTVQAQGAYRLLLEKFPNSPLAADAQHHLGAINVALLFSPKPAEEDVVYEVKSGDTLGAIATANHSTVELIKRVNGLSSDVIRPAQRLKIPKGHFSIVVNKTQNRLLLTQDNQFFKVYAVSTGKDGSTPVGTFKIVNKVIDPVWYKQGAVVPSGSSDNVLGTRWMGLDKPSYGIHGTTEPDAIGKQVTAGCVRMVNADVEELFAVVPIGTEVTIVD